MERIAAVGAYPNESDFVGSSAQSRVLKSIKYLRTILSGLSGLLSPYQPADESFRQGARIKCSKRRSPTHVCCRRETHKTGGDAIYALEDISKPSLEFLSSEGR